MKLMERVRMAMSMFLTFTCDNCCVLMSVMSLNFIYFLLFSCPFLHRTAGDTERRYHLRYFKTCMCVYETDSRGFCVKNGAHCAFAHGEHDKRPPVFDIKELQQQIQENTEETVSGPNQLDKERNMMIDDPKWQGTKRTEISNSTSKFFCLYLTISSTFDNVVLF